MKKLLASFLALVTAGLLSAQEITFGVGARGFFGFGLGSSTNVAESYDASVYDAKWDAKVDYWSSKGWTLNNHKDYGDTVDWDDQKLSVKPFESILAGGAIIGRIAFDSVPGLYIQPEIGFSHNQVKYKYSWEYDKTDKVDSKSRTEGECEGSGSMSYNAIDIPIIAGYDVDLGHGMVVSPYGGLNLSIPIGKLSWSDDAATVKTSSYYDGKLVDYSIIGLSNPLVVKTNSSSIEGKIKNGVIPGLILGTGFGYKFDDHNMIMGDLRYLLDFIPVKAEAELKEAFKKNAKQTGTAFDWTELEEKIYGGKDFRFDTFCRRALTIGVSYVYFF